MPVKVGDQGVAESPLYLTGAVRIHGERHMARSDQLRSSVRLDLSMTSQKLGKLPEK